MKALILYWSKTGNTVKVAQSILQGLEDLNADVTLTTSGEAGDIDWFDYDLVCHDIPPITGLLQNPSGTILMKNTRYIKSRDWSNSVLPDWEIKMSLFFAPIPVLIQELMRQFL